MRRFYGLGLSLLVCAFLFLSFVQQVTARQGLLKGRAEGVVSVDVANSSTEQVMAAARKVLGADGFKVVSENATQMVFDRPARLGKDVAYSGFANQEGSWERLQILIYDNGSGSFRLECNPSIVTDKGTFFEDQSETLKMFAGEYRRLMRSVAGEASRAQPQAQPVAQPQAQ